MELFNQSKTYAFMSKRFLFLGISTLFVIASIVSIFTKGFNWGIDFTGGSVVQVKYEQNAPIDLIREKLKESHLFSNASITEFGSPNEVVIKFSSTTEALGSDIGDKISEILKGSGNYEIRRVDMVGPKVGNELREKGILALTFAVAGILIYVAFRFEWRFAVASVLALLHDLIVSIGAVSAFDIEVNLDILAALLTILGYSINDSIIVFDRIREQIHVTKITTVVDLIDEAVSKTLSRTILTSLTVFLVVLTLLLFGGEIIHGFSFTLIVGVVFGTYSSVFIAAALLQYFNFSILDYRQKEVDKQKRAKEKEKLRNMTEQGTI
ncbi:MAG: protein translocase subunit SecF [Campylobacterales bacterium]|nr:protein translocase subunit SecF [Campylobacterales bacterium]